MKVVRILGGTFGIVLGYSIPVLLIMGISVFVFDGTFTMDNYLKIMGILLLALEVKQFILEESK